MRKKTSIKEPIRLRKSKLKGGGYSLYLDTYQQGRRSFEFLKLYLIPERTAMDKERNRTTLIQAEGIKAKRIIELQSGKYGAVQNCKLNRIKLSDYIRQIAEKKNGTKSHGTKGIYLQTASTIESYGDIYLHLADRQYFEGFCDYLRTCKANGRVISINTQKTKLSKVKAAMERAFKDGLIMQNTAKLIRDEYKPKGDTAERCYLTIGEIKSLAATECKLGTIKRAFLFSCFCGLRLSDIRALTWGDIHDTSEDGKQVEVRQQKTKRNVFIPLSDNAQKWLPKRPATATAEDKVFRLLPTRQHIGRVLLKWAAAAGIDKHVSFHVSRHTCATLLLTYGADIYTTSKILGHARIDTTTIYAKVIDKKRQEAVNLIPSI